MDMIKTLEELVSAFGPSGCESEISQVIEGGGEALVWTRFPGT